MRIRPTRNMRHIAPVQAIGAIGGGGDGWGDGNDEEEKQASSSSSCPHSWFGSVLRLMRVGRILLYD